MNFMLPYKFKKIGTILAPSGLAIWLCMQQGYIPHFTYHMINVVMLAITFFSFMGGIYFVTFSREKVEDEMVERTRLDSFQFAALVQVIVMIIGFLSMLLFREPGKEGMLLFFVGVISLFWLSFIGRFNYILYIRLKS